ncbi:MAG: C40 family peptidase [Eubacterium sp.]|nr:C40 family peptidase [Eubacterium sp.]
MKRLIIVTITIMALFATTVSADVIYKSVDTKEKSKAGNVTYARGVTEEMCKADYWTARTYTDADAVLMNTSEIDEINERALGNKSCNLNDLVNIPSNYNAYDLREALANEETPTRKMYVDGELIDNFTYFGRIKNYIETTGYDETDREVQYAVCVKTANIKSWPTNDIVGYSADDTDDELQLVSLNTNDPFVIKQTVNIEGEEFYWGYCDTVTGWVSADDIALCQDKEEWLDAWQVKTDAKDFVVVTQDKITLEPNFYGAYPDNIKLNFSSILKLVPEDKMPEQIGERIIWNNYIVYVPTRDENGKYVKKVAMISENKSLSVGFVPMTQTNILKLSFACLGDRYGWGGMLESMDCSMLTRNVYKCCGFVLPRNTNWQQNIPGTKTDMSEMTDEQKQAFLETMPAGTMLYMPSHTMLYLGSENGVAYVVSDLGSSVDNDDDPPRVQSIMSVAVNPLTIKRGDGSTWLTNMTAAVAFKIPVPEPTTVAHTTVAPTTSAQTVKPTVTPETKLPGTTLKKAKAKKKSLIIKWKKNSKVTGYKIQYSLKKSFKKAKTKTIKSSKTKIVLKKLKRKKTYYIRIRTYKTTGSDYKKIIFYSDWSKVIKKKTK